jgi:hypothetical protein
MATPSNQQTSNTAVYTREQIGHSVIKHTIIALFTGGISLLWVWYYCASPNHYWHT